MGDGQPDHGPQWHGCGSASPPADRTYRLLWGEATSLLGVAATTSGTLAIAAVQSSSDLTISRAGATRSNGDRLRAVSASGPSGVSTSHPAGTSNEFRVIVN